MFRKKIKAFKLIHKKGMAVALAICMGLFIPTMSVFAVESNDTNQMTKTAITYGAFSVTTEAGGTTPIYENNMLTLGSGTYTISMATKGATTTTDKIVVASGSTAAITLDGVNISKSEFGSAFDMAKANVVLTLRNNNSLTGDGSPGLRVPNKASLVINGDGKLIANGGACSAGIGGSRFESGGSITINGSTVIANAPASTGEPAGIGGGGDGASGTISITGGTVIANGCGKGIGGGAYTSSGTITISGGFVTANGIGTGSYFESHNTAITGGVVISNGAINQGNKANWIGMIFENNNDGKIYGNTFTLCNDMEIPTGRVLNIEGGKTLVIDNDRTLTNNGEIVNNGTLTNNGTISGSGTYTGSKLPISPTVSIVGWTYASTANTPTVTGNAGSGAVTYYYKLTSADDATYTTDIPSAVGDYTVKASVATTTYYASGTTTTDFTIAKADQTAPVLTPTAETISGKEDGCIGGLTTAMEYSETETGPYNVVTNPNLTFAARDYYVRYSEKNNFNASPATKVTITSGKKLAVTLPTSPVGYTLTADKTELDWNESLTITYTLESGYSEQSNFAVLVNDRAVVLNNGKYTVPNCQEDIIVTVVGVADITPPGGNITLGSNSWNQFSNTLPFNLFFKEPQTFNVLATDEVSGVSKAEYLLSNTAFDSVNDIRGTWQSIALNNGHGSFSIAPSSKQYIYVKFTDNAGNSSVINTEGIVIYEDATATDTLTYILSSKTDTMSAIDLKGNTVKSIKNGETTISSNHYKIVNGKIIFSGSYLDTLKAGTHTLSVSYHPLGETFVKGQDANDSVITLTVKQKDPNPDTSDLSNASLYVTLSMLSLVILAGYAFMKKRYNVEK